MEYKELAKYEDKYVIITTKRGERLYRRVIDCQPVYVLLEDAAGYQEQLLLRSLRKVRLDTDTMVMSDKHGV